MVGSDGVPGNPGAPRSALGARRAITYGEGNPKRALREEGAASHTARIQRAPTALRGV